MRLLFIAFLIMSVLGVNSFAECSYFRVSTALLKCGVVDSKVVDTSNPYENPSDVPELEAPERQALVKVTCDCGYSLMGSDPRCEMDQSSEKSVVLGAETPESFCRRGRSL